MDAVRASERLVGDLVLGSLYLQDCRHTTKDLLLFTSRAVSALCVYAEVIP